MKLRNYQSKKIDNMQTEIRQIKENAQYPISFGRNAALKSFADVTRKQNHLLS